MSFSFILLLSLAGFGSTGVMVELTTNTDLYGVGDSATLHCFITSDDESMPSCKLDWDIITNNSIVDPRHFEKYKDRVFIGPKNRTHSFMTLKDLKADDTEEILCSAVCVINGVIQTADKKTSKLKIYAPEVTYPTSPGPLVNNSLATTTSWMKFLFFTLNLSILFTVTIICICIIRKRRINQACVISNM